ncbi:MAG: hypothetical protein HC886_13300 [Leptolyngbyaceae cyanobacterium SM1_1_3]|nr:hypothetical protein [Leptolyngbyaceae cyanobacterium SM1_1_3]NJN01655.1 hypothetical protein [Leptolyngbyaceae cyanobacterium RM1_1_2]
MTLSPLQKTFISSVFISSALFTIATVPLAVFRSQPVEVRLQNQSVFSSELNTITGPYLGITGAFSAALGMGIFGIGGWRFAASKSEAEKAKASELERSLTTYQAELERIKFSEARLKAQNLEGFLEPHNPSVAQMAVTPAARISSPIHSEPEMVQHRQVSVVQGDLLVNDTKTLMIVPELENGKAQISHGQSTAPENQIDLVLHQLRDLAAQVEDLRSGNSNKLAA